MTGLSRVFYAALAAVASFFAGRRVSSAERWRDRAQRWDAMARRMTVRSR